jgi:NAD(P)-dependent dehydrogenase (short-subunit alcohol dehydrogenase family)
MGRLKGKTAVVTGAARGIGYGIASRFVREGADLVLLDVRREELAQSAARLTELAANAGQGFAPRVESIVCDLADPAQVFAAAASSWAKFGKIDILVNNAGIATREPFVDIPYERWQRIMDVNVNAVFLLSQAISKQMIQSGVRGSIVNMASKNGLAGSSVLAHYNASKGAVVLLTQSMAVDLAPHGIRVNAVAPGFIDTPLDRELKAKETQPLDLTQRTPMGRLGTIDEVANAFLFLASDEASYITGTTLVVDGGHLANAGDF